MPEKPSNILIGLIIFLVIIGGGALITNNTATKQSLSNIISSNSQPRLEANSFTPDIKGFNQTTSIASTPIFAAVLEYDPAKGSVFQKSTKKVDTDMFIKGAEKINDSSDVFAYKIQVTSPKNTLIQDGWYELPLTLAKTKDNTIEFQIQTFYEKNAIVRVMLPNEKIIWTGIIE